jgi:hypothetical protein
MKSNLRGQFLAAIGYAPAAHESVVEAFARLRTTSPDLFPVPRGSESFWDAIAEVVTRHEGR